MLNEDRSGTNKIILCREFSSETGKKLDILNSAPRISSSWRCKEYISNYTVVCALQLGKDYQNVCLLFEQLDKSLENVGEIVKTIYHKMNRDIDSYDSTNSKSMRSPGLLKKTSQYTEFKSNKNAKFLSELSINDNEFIGNTLPVSESDTRKLQAMPKENHSVNMTQTVDSNIVNNNVNKLSAVWSKLDEQND